MVSAPHVSFSFSISHFYDAKKCNMVPAWVKSYPQFIHISTYPQLFLSTFCPQVYPHFYPHPVYNFYPHFLSTACGLFLSTTLSPLLSTGLPTAFPQSYPHASKACYPTSSTNFHARIKYQTYSLQYMYLRITQTHNLRRQPLSHALHESIT